MTDLNLRDLQTLADLQSALARFADGTREGLQAAEAEIRRTQEWLQERVGHWQRQVEEARRAVARAEADLRRCEASGYYDRDGRYYPPDCRAEMRALAQAQAHLRECEDNLRTAQAWRSRVQQAVNEYQREARRLDEIAGGHTEKARSFLKRVEGKYGEVLSAASSVGTVGAVVAGLMGLAAPSARQGITWAEHRAILKRLEAGESITLDDLAKLKLPVSDLQTGTLQEDTGWIQGLIDGEGYLEAMRDSREAQDLRDALLATLKAINYWRSKS